MPEVVYTKFDSDIHRFVFSKSTRKEVDFFIEHLTLLLDDADSSDCLSFLIDLRPDGLPPISYTLGRLRTIFAKYPNQPQMFGAYLYENNMLISLLSTFMDSLRLRSARRMFKGDAEDQAMEWLLEQMRPYR